MNIEGLEIGVYTFIIYVYDSYGNTVSDTVNVTVTASSVTTGSETTSSETTEISISKSDKPDSNFLQFSVFLISIVSMIIIQRLRKFR